MGYSFRLAARVLLYAPSYRQDNTYHGLCYTSHGALAGTRNSSMGLPDEGLIRWPIHYERTLLPRSYISLPPAKEFDLFLCDYFSFQPVLHDWCNKGCGMCYPVCGMMQLKEPLLIIGKSSPCGCSGFHLSLSEWSFTICMTPYNCE